jgi:hypothetical protein
MKFTINQLSFVSVGAGMKSKINYCQKSMYLSLINLQKALAKITALLFKNR